MSGLASILSQQLQCPVLAAGAQNPMPAIRALLAQDVRQVIVLPLGDDSLEAYFKLAGQRWPFLAFHHSKALEWSRLADLIVGEIQKSPGSGVVLTAASAGLETDCNLARLAWLVEAKLPSHRVFCAHSREQFELRKTELETIGFSAVVELAWDELGPVLASALVEQYQQTQAKEPIVRPGWSEMIAVVDEAAAIADLERRMKEILPPSERAASPQPMGSAPMKTDDGGEVAWDEMWTDFCDLAMAGGPSHRGTLLEAVAAEECRAEPERYQAVVAEIARGISMVTALPVHTSASLGWVGVECDCQEMALWLVRAIIVENVMVRREENTIFLPAGPNFSLQGEIKNVITVVAKTVHYWSAHRSAQLASSARS